MKSSQLTYFLYFCICIYESSSSTIPLVENEKSGPIKGVVSRNSIKNGSTSDYVYSSSPLSHGILMPDMRVRRKRTPSGFTARGFHEGVFDRDFGHFSPVKRTHKRRPEADASGFYGDTFSNGFGDFETMKRDGGSLSDEEYQDMVKRTEMGANGFHGDTFTQGFGNFGTMKRMLVGVKRKPEMTKTGFHGDVFNNGFGEFHPMR